MRGFAGWVGMAAACLVLWVASGCSTRMETPSAAADSTMVYLGKTPGDIDASITFAGSSKISKKTGRRLGVKDVFDIGQDEKVYAFVDLANTLARGHRELSFHLVWLDPDEDTIYKKRVEEMAGDSMPALSSVLSLPPKRRSPGRYLFRVYLFRELIAEKAFTVRGDAATEQELKSGSDDF